MRRCQQLHFFQLFNPALRLTRLGGFGFKTVNKFLQMCAGFNLLFKGLLLLGQTFAAGHFKGRVIAGI